MTRKEKIIEILNKHYMSEYYIEDKNNAIADAIIALPIDVPSEEEIETSALRYRDESDDMYTNEDTMQIEVHWYDKQEAFTAGFKLAINEILKRNGKEENY